MDESNKLSREDYARITSMIESSGGKNLKHKKMTGGIHEGDSAQGQYGIMPNTAEEFDRRSRKAGLEPAKNEDEQFNRITDFIAAKTDDPRKQTYMYEQGHNLDPNKITEEQLAASPRVQKFSQLQSKLGIQMPKAKAMAKAEPSEVPEIVPEAIEPAPQDSILAAPPEAPVAPEMPAEPKPALLQAALSPEKPVATPKAVNPYDYKFKDFDTITARTDASRIRSPEELRAKLKGRV